MWLAARRLGSRGCADQSCGSGRDIACQAAREHAAMARTLILPPFFIEASLISSGNAYKSLTPTCTNCTPTIIIGSCHTSLDMSSMFISLT